MHTSPVFLSPLFGEAVVCAPASISIWFSRASACPTLNTLVCCCLTCLRRFCHFCDSHRCHLVQGWQTIGLEMPEYLWLAMSFLRIPSENHTFCAVKNCPCNVALSRENCWSAICDFSGLSPRSSLIWVFLQESIHHRLGSITFSFWKSVVRTAQSALQNSGDATH